MLSAGFYFLLSRGLCDAKCHCFSPELRILACYFCFKSSQHLLIRAYINHLNFHHMPMHVCVLNHFTHVQLFPTSWTEAARLLCPWNFPSKNTVVGTASAVKSLQSCLTLCDPIDGSPPGSPVPEILQARTLEWVAISFSSAGK